MPPTKTSISSIDLYKDCSRATTVEGNIVDSSFQFLYSYNKIESKLHNTYNSSEVLLPFVA